MKRWAGRARQGKLWIAVIILGLASLVWAQPPERFRLDFSFSSIRATDTQSFLGGDFAPRAGLVGPTDILALFDLSGTLNVTERLSLTAGVPFGIVEDFADAPRRVIPGLTRGDIEFGLGDVHMGAGYQLISQGQFFPGLHVQVEAGAPTAEFAGLGTGFWRVTGRASISKSLHPRFSVFANGSYSHFFEKENLDPGPITSYGGGIGIGITRAVILTVHVEEVNGGEIKENGAVVAPSVRDLRAGIGTTLFSRGRPQNSVVLLVGRLQDKPTVILTLRWALFSL